MLLAGEPFFLGGGYDVVAAGKGCRAVVIKRGDAENVHALEKCVNEWRDCGSVGQDEQTSK